MFSGWLYAVALAGLYLLAGWRLGAAAYLAIFAALTLAAAGLMYRWLKTRGAKRFAVL